MKIAPEDEKQIEESGARIDRLIHPPAPATNYGADLVLRSFDQKYSRVRREVKRGNLQTIEDVLSSFEHWRKRHRELASHRPGGTGKL